MCSLASWVKSNADKKIRVHFFTKIKRAIHIMYKKLLSSTDLGSCLQAGKTCLKCSLLCCTQFFTVVEQLFFSYLHFWKRLL